MTVLADDSERGDVCGPTFRTCQPWCDFDDVVRIGGGCEDWDHGLVEDATEIASETLFELVPKYRGICEVTVKACGVRWPRSSSPMPLLGYQTDSPEVVTWGGCTCNRPPGRSCGCCGPPQVRLGYSPIVDVRSVLVDGVEIDPATYHVDDQIWLVRDPDPVTGAPLGWPCCVPFLATVCYGLAPPPLGVAAAARFAAELVKLWTGAEDCCLVARNVTTMTRENLTVQVASPNDFVLAGLFGITEVDLFVKTYNPQAIKRPPRVLSPDTRPRSTRQTWP